MQEFKTGDIVRVKGGGIVGFITKIEPTTCGKTIANAYQLSNGGHWFFGSNLELVNPANNEKVEKMQKFNLGDRVRIVKKPRDGWNPLLDSCIGDVGIIEKVNFVRTEFFYNVRLGDKGCWNIKDESLELVNPANNEKVERMTEFKKGDRVRIVKKSENGWVRQMDVRLGTEGVVQTTNPFGISDSCKVVFDDKDWWTFKNECLEPVNPANNEKVEKMEKFKVGDYVMVKNESEVWEELGEHQHQFNDRKKSCGKVHKITKIHDCNFKNNGFVYEIESTGYIWKPSMISEVPILKVGDKVQICKKLKEGELHWISYMDSTVGKKGVVGKEYYTNFYNVRFEDGNYWTYHISTLQKLEELEQKEDEKMPQKESYKELVSEIVKKIKESVNSETDSKLKEYVKISTIEKVLKDSIEPLKKELDSKYVQNLELDKKVSKSEMLEILNDLEKVVLSREVFEQNAKKFTDSVDTLEKLFKSLKVSNDEFVKICNGYDKQKREEIDKLSKFTQEVVSENKKLKLALENIEERVQKLENSKDYQNSNFKDCEMKDLKVGDVVRIKTFEECMKNPRLGGLDFEYENYARTKHCGKVTTVKEIFSSNSVMLQNVPMSYYYKWLEKLEDVKIEENPKVENVEKFEGFKVGDSVKIVKRSEKNHKWNRSGLMDWTLGQVGKVTSTEHDSCRVQLKKGLEGQSWRYDNECLELVKSENVKKIEKVPKKSAKTEDEQVRDLLKKIMQTL